MHNHYRITKILIVVLFLLTNYSFGQEKYKFTTEKELKATSVKNQGLTGTCWCFATCSLLESEIFRKGLDEQDFSEMFIVRCAFIEKAILYVRMHGKSNFGQGGEGHDVINLMRKYGMVPKEAYSGILDDKRILNHDEMEIELRNYLDTLMKQHADKLPEDWLKPYEKILDRKMGKVPSSFEYKGKKYTSQSFLKDYLGINPDDYIEFTSFSHHPFYSKFLLEVPDNWSYDLYNNVKVDELIQLIDTSIAKGYTVGWGGDITENEFSSNNGIAIVPINDWEHKSDKEKERTSEIREKEMIVTQEIRQKEFDNWTTTDDHFMHIVGIAKDQYGDKFYITKNSWGKQGSKDGYVYLSEEYVKLKTTTMILNKNAISANILEENNLK
jgi:bleomycin hydrolase